MEENDCGTCEGSGYVIVGEGDGWEEKPCPDCNHPEETNEFLER